MYYLINRLQLVLAFILLQLAKSRGQQEELQFHQMSRFSSNQDDKQFQDVDLSTVLQTPIASSTSPNSEGVSSSIPSLYSDYHAQKFRVNVSNLCESNQMHVVIRFNRPFYGLIHTKDNRKRPACQVKGTGNQAYTLDISYTLVQSESNYCGVVSHQLTGNNQTSKQATLSVALVVRLHKAIEFSDDRYFLLSCANRCLRPDCSSSATNQMKQSSQEAQSGTQSAFKGLIASESIVNPTLRTSFEPALANSTLAKQLNDRNSWSSGLSQRCDLTGTTRFQWLIKLSWALSALLLVTFLTAIYLCIALSNSKRADRRRRDSKQIKSQRAIYPRHGSQTSTWSFSNKEGSRSILMDKKEDFNKMREDNSYLAEQHQSLVLNSFKSSQSHQNSSPHQVIGRAAETEFLNLNAVDRHLQDSHVKRRRSIGSVTGMATSSRQQSRRSTTLGGLGADQKAKSRSQATIYYDQSQDPFKANPFNDNYLSDSAAELRQNINGTISSVASKLPPMDVNHNYNYAPTRPLDEQATHSLPPEVAMNHIMQASSFSELASRPDVMQQLQRYTAFKPTYMAPAVRMIRPPHIPQQHFEQSSQFDPQNSRQLLDLIQQKHRQQMAHASRTAASIKSLTTMDLMETQQRH